MDEWTVLCHVQDNYQVLHVAPSPCLHPLVMEMIYTGGAHLAWLPQVFL